jgi:hypothetical protein
MNATLNHKFGKIILALAAALFCASSSWASIVWDLNPTNANASAGSNTQIFTSSGFQITARGYDNNAGFGTAHDLFFKNIPPINGAGEHGLGLTNILDNELQLTAQGAVANFIQLDLSSILMQGFVNGQVKVGSLQPGESFQLFGSNTQGTLGTAIGTPFGSAFDDQFVPIADFGLFKFISIAAASFDVLPVAFRADLAPVPEMSALFPILGLAVAIGSTRILRRRRLSERSSAAE